MKLKQASNQGLHAEWTELYDGSRSEGPRSEGGGSAGEEMMLEPWLFP